MRKKIIAGNWKMYKTPSEAKTFMDAFLPAVKDHTRDEIVLYPPALSLTTVVEAARGSHVLIGGQTMHWLNEGAYTGQISPSMLQSTGATDVLLGHSEQRTYNGEIDEYVNLKLRAAINHGIRPMVCIGEAMPERKANLTADVLIAQIAGGLAGVPEEAASNLVIAYEPVWAIGSGQSATPDQAEEAHIIIRAALARFLGREAASCIRILYGGSVKPSNIAALLRMPNIDGALIGGASLKPNDFVKMVKYQLA